MRSHHERSRDAASPRRERLGVTASGSDMIRGTLDMLILKVLSLEPMHGWGISERIQQMSEETLQVNQGSLYPALHKLRRMGWIVSAWRVTENNRKARYYELTPSGAKQLGLEHEHWLRLSSAVARVMEAGLQEG